MIRYILAVLLLLMVVGCKTEKQINTDEGTAIDSCLSQDMAVRRSVLLMRSGKYRAVGVSRMSNPCDSINAYYLEVWP